MRLLPITIAFAALAACSPSEPVNREPEPAPEMIASGKCHVPVCYELDLEDSKFRIYTANRAILYRYIPKGACSCASVRNDPGFFGSAASMRFETSDSTQIGNVAVGRAKDSEDINLRTTYERFLSERDKFGEMSDFHYRGFDFSEYRVYRERETRGPNSDSRRYYFIPRNPQFIIRESRMEIAFHTPLARSLGDERQQLDVATNIRLSDNIYYFQFFNPRLTPPAQWPATVEKTVELIELRMFPN